MATDRDLWKNTIKYRLKLRNKREQHGFTELIDTHNRLADTVSSLKSRNVQLTVEAERLKDENRNLQMRVDTGGGGGGGGGTNNQMVEQKLYKLQEELTEMHRKKGENAQQIIDLTNAMKEKEHEIQLKDSKILDCAAIENSLKTEIKHLEHTVYELEATNQTLKDEHQALQMAFSALEEKFRKTQEDNSELMARWLDQKLKQADRMNEENDHFQRRRQEKIQRDLQEAARTEIKVPEGSDVMSGILPICLSSSLPSKAQHVVDAHDGEVNAVQWNPTGSLFATGGSDRKIKLWEVNGGLCTVKGTLLGSNAGVTSLEFDLEEGFILGASNDHASRLWSVSDQRLRHTLTGHSGKVLSAKFLGDSARVVSGSHDRTLKIWDLHSRACIKTIFAGSSCNDLVTLHGTNIVSGHFDKRVRFWDSRSENTTNEIGLQGRITSLSLAPDRTSLLACARDDTLRIIDLRMNQVVHTLAADNFRTAFDWSRAVYSPDGSYVAAGSSDGTLFIWNVETEKVERSLKEHSHAIIACAWHPAGCYILSTEKQKKLILWSDI